MPLLRLRDRLDQRVSGQKKASHVLDEEKSVCDPAENTKGRLKVEHVTHDGDPACLGEKMIVIETLESAADHLSRGNGRVFQTP